MIRIHYSWWQALGIQYINMKKCLDGQIINFGIYKIKVMNKYSIIQMGEISYYFNQFSIWPLYYVIPQDPQITHLDASIDPWLILGDIFCRDTKKLYCMNKYLYAEYGMYGLLHRQSPWVSTRFCENSSFRRHFYSINHKKTID